MTATISTVLSGRSACASGRPPARTLARARRVVLALAGAFAFAAATLAPPNAAAQPAWPSKPVVLIVPYAAGQGADVLMRLIAEEIAKTLHATFVVENRPGAGGNIGAGIAARAAPDGYTFMIGTSATQAANEFLYPNAGFSAATDFDAVGMIGLLPMVISTSLPDLPTNGLPALIARARAKPGELAVGLPSTTAEVVLAQFVKDAQAPLFAVKYKASAQAMTDALGGHVPIVIDTVTATRPRLADGKMRALAITSKNPSEMLPGVKSVAEQGVPGFDIVAWDALFAPHGTPPEIIAKVSEALRHALEQPAVRRRLLDIGVEPLVMDPAQLGRYVRDERVKWGAAIQAAGLKGE